MEVDKADLVKLDQAVLRAEKGARNGIDGAVKRLTLLAVVSAAKATKLSKKRRQKKVAKWSQKKKKAENVPDWAEYRLEWWKDDQMSFAYAKDANHLKKLKTPKYRGAAKFGWWQQMRGFAGKPPKVVSDSSGKIKKIVGNLKTKKAYGHLVEAEVTNKVKYISKIAPDAARIGIRNAISRFEKTEKNKIAKQIQKGWKK